MSHRQKNNQVPRSEAAGAALLGFALLWVYLLAPILSPFAGRSAQAMVTTAVKTTQTDSVAAVVKEADHVTCYCRMCRGPKQCCCLPPKADTSVPENTNRCALRATCDMGDPDRVIAARPETPLPPSMAVPVSMVVTMVPTLLPVSVVALPSRAYDIPDAPPRFLS